MNKIEKLIEELCPQGVEFKKLGEVCIIKTGQSVNKILIDQHQGDYPVINSGKEPLGYIDTFNTENDPIGITSRGAGVGSITWCVGKYFRGNLNYSATIIDEEILNVRYLYFVLMNSQKQINELSVFNGIPALNASSLVKLKIPIPPLAIQKEIVKILDNFIRLEAELEAELEARKKQYEYYREELLTFGGDVEWKALGEVCDVRDGTHDSPKQKLQGNFLITSRHIKGNKIEFSTAYKISVEDFNNINKRSKVDKYDVLFSMIGTIGEMVIIDFEPDFAIKNIALFKTKNNKELAKWIYYYLTTNEAKFKINSLLKGSAQKYIALGLLRGFLIPIPPLSKQKEIVATLDKFDALVNDISIGLPAEITARKKQYEYYRNQLLEFKVMSYE